MSLKRRIEKLEQSTGVVDRGILEKKLAGVDPAVSDVIRKWVQKSGIDPNSGIIDIWAALIVKPGDDK